MFLSGRPDLDQVLIERSFAWLAKHSPETHTAILAAPHVPECGDLIECVAFYLESLEEDYAKQGFENVDEYNLHLLTTKDDIFEDCERLLATLQEVNAIPTTDGREARARWADLHAEEDAERADQGSASSNQRWQRRNNQDPDLEDETEVLVNPWQDITSAPHGPAYWPGEASAPVVNPWQGMTGAPDQHEHGVDGNEQRPEQRSEDVANAPEPTPPTGPVSKPAGCLPTLHKPKGLGVPPSTLSSGTGRPPAPPIPKNPETAYSPLPTGDFRPPDPPGGGVATRVKAPNQGVGGTPSNPSADNTGAIGGKTVIFRHSSGASTIQKTAESEIKRTPFEKAAGPNLTLLRCPSPKGTPQWKILEAARKATAKVYPKRSPAEWANFSPELKLHWVKPQGPLFSLMSLSELCAWEDKNKELGGPGQMTRWPTPQDPPKEILPSSIDTPGCTLAPPRPVYGFRIGEGPAFVRPKRGTKYTPPYFSGSSSDDNVVWQGEPVAPRVSLSDTPGYDSQAVEAERQEIESGVSPGLSPTLWPSADEIASGAQRQERRKLRNIRNYDHNLRMVRELSTLDPSRSLKYLKRVERADRDVAADACRLRRLQLNAETTLSSEMPVHNTFAALASSGEDSTREIEPIPGLWTDVDFGLGYKHVLTDSDVPSDEEALERSRNQHLYRLYDVIAQATGAHPTGIDGFPPVGPVTYHGPCSERLPEDHPDRGQLEFVKIDNQLQEQGSILLPQPKAAVVMKGWSASQKLTAIVQAARSDSESPEEVKAAGRWANGPPPGFLRMRVADGTSPAWEDTNQRMLDLVGPLELIGPPSVNVVFPRSPFSGEISSPRELFPLGVPVTQEKGDLWWWCYNRAFFFYAPDCPLGTNENGVWSVCMNGSNGNRFHAKKMRERLERASVDVANWLTAKIIVERHLKRVNAHSTRQEKETNTGFPEEEIRDVRVREVIEGYNLGKSSDIYSPRGYRPLPYHSQDGVVSRGTSPIGVHPAGHGGVSRRLPPKFHPFACAAIGSGR